MFKKKILILPVLFFILILIIFFYLLIIDRNPSEIPSALLNKKAPSFQTNRLLSDKNFNSESELIGKVNLVNFFATWCKPCRDEHKYIQKFSSNKKIKVIGINYKDDPEKAINWLNELGNPYSIVGIDEKGKIAIDWGVYGLPETFIINSKGLVKYKYIGPITKKEFKKINSILKSIF